MIKLVSAIFRSYPNEAHFKIFDRITDELKKSGQAVQTATATHTPELYDWFAKETACIAWYRKSSLTALIADADNRLDRALIGMSAQVNAARYSPDHTVAAAAENLHIMLHSYGQVFKKPYLQEMGAVKAILAHLNGDLSAEAQTAGLASWITEVEAAFGEFLTLFEQREAQTLEKPEQRFPAVRSGIEKVWHQIAVLINSGTALNLSPDFEAFINVINPEITYMNSEFHRAKHDISAAQISSIEQQPFTGQPCTPVPDVFFETSKETLKLTLGKDFNITYKNNINAGNAECTVHGKGRYKGSKTVTFIIA
ncbi:MAG: DUF6261 family protein [Tannerella sp.]|jgi:hypothetical protein|nr:DUF6261 family protein [Tannerella sp.]